MKTPIVIILPENKLKELLDKCNKGNNTSYSIDDIGKIIEYKDNIRNIMLIEIIFKDYTVQRFKKDNFEIDNFI